MTLAVMLKACVCSCFNNRDCSGTALQVTQQGRYRDQDHDAANTFGSKVGFKLAIDSPENMRPMSESADCQLLILRY